MVGRKINSIQIKYGIPTIESLTASILEGAAKTTKIQIFKSFGQVNDFHVNGNGGENPRIILNIPNMALRLGGCQTEFPTIGFVNGLSIGLPSYGS